jgi:hypothetical protein
VKSGTCPHDGSQDAAADREVGCNHVIGMLNMIWAWHAVCLRLDVRRKVNNVGKRKFMCIVPASHCLGFEVNHLV